VEGLRGKAAYVGGQNENAGKACAISVEFKSREAFMARFTWSILVLGCMAISLIALRTVARQAAQGGTSPAKAPQRVQRPPLFFREDWKLDPNIQNPGTEQEHVVGIGDLTNPNLDLKLYGDKNGPVVVFQGNDDITFVMTLLCTANCGIALRERNNYVGLSGLAKIRWRVRENGYHLLRPIVKLANGSWLVGDQTVGYSPDWIESEIAISNIRWRNLDIEKVVEAPDGKWVENPDLAKVDEVGFTDLMRGSGHGQGGGSRVDWIEVYGKPVPR
jgi:hypothetical protein